MESKHLSQEIGRLLFLNEGGLPVTFQITLRWQLSLEKSHAWSRCTNYVIKEMSWQEDER